jgi:hypothetical protein
MTVCRLRGADEFLMKNESDDLPSLANLAGFIIHALGITGA